MTYRLYVCVPSHLVSDSLQPDELYVAYQAPLSMGFSRQEYWRGLPFPPSGDLPNPGIGLPSLASCLLHWQADSSPLEPPGKLNVQVESDTNVSSTPRASLAAQTVKDAPVMWETWVRSLSWKYPWRRECCPLQYSGLKNSMDYIVHGVTKNQIRLSNFHSLSHWWYKDPFL